jgi:hypothetical protein
MTELSPYQIELRQDLIDYEAMRHGLDAYERAEEFYKLPEELQARLREVV